MAAQAGASPDHIAALTQGLTLPLRALRSEHLGAILHVVSAAWLKLQSDHPNFHQIGDEKQVTALLEPLLNSFIHQDPRCRNLVLSVARGKETPNFDASKLEMRPDLSLFLAHPRHNFPLVVECKIIDHPSGKTVSLYCSKGIDRFVVGDYAWATCEAIMLAYVRDGSSVPSALTPHLCGCSVNAPDPFYTLTQPEPAVPVHQTVHWSEHGRSFTYLSGIEGQAPGPIKLWHLWL